jgi:hypothetical protein
MMKTIFITSDGKIYKMNYFGRLERNEVTTIKNYLNCILHIEEGTTFETFFNIILKDKDFFSEVFKETMGGFDLNQFIKEWKNNVEIKNNHNISYLEVYRDINLKDNTGIITLDVMNVFEGVIKKEDGEKERLSLDFIPISSLKKIPLRINNDFNIPGQIIENVNMLTSVKEMTLFEVIESILYDITFYGDPKSRDQIKEDVMNGYNKDTMIQLLTFDMEDLVSDEKYEEAIEILNLINKYKKSGEEEIDSD